MLTNVSEEEWNRIRGKAQGNSIFCDPLFVNCVAGVYRVKPVYYALKESERFSMGFVAYVRRGQIVQPNYVLYSGFIYDPVQDSAERVKSFNTLLSVLRKNFSAVSWKAWLGNVLDQKIPERAFVISERKTYIKQLDNLSYKQDVHRRIRIAEKNNIVLKADQDQEEGLDWHCREFRDKYRQSRRFVKGIRSLLLLLGKHGLISYYHAYFENKMAASAILFKDEPHQRAYLWYLTTDPAYHRLGAHGALYDFFFRDLKAKGYMQVDLCGANIPSIAAYKAGFLPDLHRYYELSYAGLLTKLTTKMKQVLKKLSGST